MKLLLVLAMAIGTAHAAEGPFASPLADSTLQDVRGGYDAGGVQVSFGIERSVYVNGALVGSSGTMAVIENGAGNSVSSLSTSTAGGVIQNTLDGQKIQNVTVINATANSLGMYRGLNLGASLRGAVIDSLRR